VKGDSEHSSRESILKALQSSFSSTYLTLMSIIQGAGLGYLVFVVDNGCGSFRPVNWLLSGTTFLIILAAWNEYAMGATAFVWVPRFRDSLIPFALGASELLLIRSISLDLRYWFFAAALVSFVALLAFLNMYGMAGREGGQNEGVLNAIKAYRWLNPAWCAICAIVFATFGLIASVPTSSRRRSMVLAVTSLLIILVFLGRGASDWNEVIVEGCADLVNFLSIHHYENPDNYARGPRSYERFFRETGALIAASKNPGLKVYVSEWNSQSTDWRTGLYCGGLLNAFERCGDILEIGGPALFLRHVSARSGDNAFINFDHRTWFPAPNYVVMRLWREHYAPERIQLDGDTGPLNAVVTKSADGKTLYLKIVNPSEEPVPVRLTLKEGFRVGKASMQIVSPDSVTARNSLDEPTKIRLNPHQVRTEGGSIAFTMPRWSAGVVTVGGQQPE